MGGVVKHVDFEVIPGSELLSQRFMAIAIEAPQMASGIMAVYTLPPRLNKPKILSPLHRGPRDLCVRHQSNSRRLQSQQLADNSLARRQ